LEAAPPHFFDGELDGVVFISVPATTSYNSCERLREMIDAAYSSKKQVVILTHNIELLKVTKLDSGTAAAVIKTIQGDADPNQCELCGGSRDGAPAEEDPASKIIVAS
jgi:hypothetical protein